MDACRRRYSILMAVLPRARRSTTFAPPPSNPSGHASQSGHPAQCHGLLIRHHYGGLRRGRAVHASASEPRWVADNVHPGASARKMPGSRTRAPAPSCSLPRFPRSRILLSSNLYASRSLLSHAARCSLLLPPSCQPHAPPRRPSRIIVESGCHLHSAIGHPSTAPAVAWPYMHPAA